MQDDLLKKTKKRKIRTIAIVVILALLAASAVWGMSIKKANDKQKAKAETVQSENEKSDSTKAEKKTAKAVKKEAKEKSKKSSSSSSSSSENKSSAAAATSKKAGNYVTISINCSELSKNMSRLTDKSVADYIPSNGVILGSKRYKFKSGDTVYDALESVCRSKGIHLDSEYDSTYDTRYIKGIGYLYEKDAGSNSGWLYYVNGVKPDYGCSQYNLKKGDVIKWKYTVNYTND